MIEEKIEALFTSINNSPEYQRYQTLSNALDQNQEIKQLVAEIKKLQKQAVNLQVKKDPKYQEIDLIVNEKVKLLNNDPLYQEYINSMNELNELLLMVSNMLEQYVNSKFQN